MREKLVPFLLFPYAPENSAHNDTSLRESMSVPDLPEKGCEVRSDLIGHHLSLLDVHIADGAEIRMSERETEEPATRVTSDRQRPFGGSPGKGAKIPGEIARLHGAIDPEEHLNIRWSAGQAFHVHEVGNGLSSIVLQQELPIGGRQLRPKRSLQRFDLLYREWSPRVVNSASHVHFSVCK